MSKKNNDNSKSSSYFNNYASGIKFKYKHGNKLRRSDFVLGDEHSANIELEEKPELNKKHKNEIEFKPSTKQTIDQNKYKTFKKKYNIEEEIDEREEEDEQIEEKNSIKNKKNETPPSKIRASIYTEQNYKKQKNKIIKDEDDNEEEDKIVIENKINNSLDEKQNEDDIESKYDYKYSKGIKSEGGDFEHRLKFKKNKNKNKKVKFNETEYQRIISESKNYLPFKEYDMNKYLLNSSEVNNIKQNPELYSKYLYFLSLKKKQDKIQKEVLIKNILKAFKSIYQCNSYNKEFKVNALFKNQDLTKFVYKSNEKTAYFDLFICFISMYINGYEDFVESTSINSINKLVIPLHALAFIYSSQVFFSNAAKLIHNYYDKFLSYKIIPIYSKEEDEYKKRIETRQIIWKQFENPFFYYKNDKKLYNEEKKINEKKIKQFSEKIGENINDIYNNFAKETIERHKGLNEFDINDNNITILNKQQSAPSSSYNQIKKDLLFKLKMNLYKYKMRKINIKKRILMNDAIYSKNDFNNKVKNKIFKQSVFYMNPIDVTQDFLDNYE